MISCNVDGRDILVSIEGTVVHGKGFGRFMSIPTANIDTSCDISFLEEGVYCSCITIGDIVRCGTVNIGRRPTVDNMEKVTIEVNILDFNSDIYGSSVVLDVFKLLRPTQRFDSLSHLIRQIRSDSLATLDYFGIGLGEKGIAFRLEADAIVFDGVEVSFDEKGLGLMFIMLVNPSCSFTFEQIYQSVWHENVCKESSERVAMLVDQVNEKLLSNGIHRNIVFKDGGYAIEY